VANGFSARGWAPDGASLALRRSEEALRSTGQFIDGLASIKREEATKIGGALCDAFRNDIVSSADSRAAASSKTPKKSKFGRSRSDGRSNQSGHDNEDTDTMLSSSFSRENKLKTSPLFFPGSTLHAAATSLLQYHMADSKGHERDDATTEGALAELRMAAQRTAHRAANREAALSRAHRHVEEAEAILSARQAEAKTRWDAMHKVEAKVQKVYEERVRERSRELYNRKRQSEEKLLRQRESESEGKHLDSGVTEAEIWQLVNQIGGEDSSFHPIGLPEAPRDLPKDKSLADGASDHEEEFENDDETSSAAPSSSGVTEQNQSLSSNPPLPPVDICDVEFDLNLPSLRAAAREADFDVEDAATVVLNALSALDTTYRSARIAAESALLSAANSQAEALKCMVQQERAALEAKLKQVAGLERQVNTMDVRADLDAYIAFDRRERPGSSTRLGEDDDGGVASALAVLDGHAEGTEHGLDGSCQSLSSFERFGGGEDGAGIENESTKDMHKGIALSREEVEKVISNLFAERNEDYVEGSQDLDDAGSLVLAVSLRSPRGRSCRASTCYALNKQRSVRTEVATNEQFDGLCRVFYALLKGCDTRIPSDVANAKMCMMLSHTFYVVDHDNVFGEESAGNAVDERKMRLYVKSTLVNHKLFSHDEFWQQALFQCVTESLSGSGVVSTNFDSSSAASRLKQSKWYELNTPERAEAASQIHAVIFAQLGALSHSMIEFGCEIEQACAFVRRLSIQHQLPLSQRAMLLQHLIGRQKSFVEDGTADEVYADAAEYTSTADTDSVEIEPASTKEVDDDDEVESNDDESGGGGAIIGDDSFVGTKTKPSPGTKRLIALLSRGVPDRNQSAHQGHCLAILKARKTPYEVVDGNDAAQMERRDELFGISGTRGHYPQFFLSSYDEAGKETTLTYLGDYHRFKDLNDTIDLPKEIVEDNPELETWDRVFQDCT